MMSGRQCFLSQFLYVHALKTKFIFFIQPNERDAAKAASLFYSVKCPVQCSSPLYCRPRNIPENVLKNDKKRRKSDQPPFFCAISIRTDIPYSALLYKKENNFRYYCYQLKKMVDFSDVNYCCPDATICIMRE